MRHCLVTGGAGFIGSHLAETLLARGWKVRVLDDLSTGKAVNLRGLESEITLFQGSVTDPASLWPAVEGCDVVFHLAAIPSVARSVDHPLPTHEACATGTLHVLEAARRAGVRRVVYAASSSAYGSTPGSVRREDDPTNPISPYAVAKLAGEHYCRSYTAVHGLETVRLRFFNIFGPRQDPHSPYSGVIPAFGMSMLQGRAPTVHGDGLQSRDFTYVGNTVEGVIQAADATDAVGNVYNLGSGGSTSLLDLVRLLNEILGTRLEPVHVAARPGDVRHSRADITLARKDLGYEPSISFLEGLRRTVDHLREILRNSP